MSGRNFFVRGVEVQEGGNTLINYGGTGTVLSFIAGSGVPRNFVRRGGGSTNSVEDRENGDLGALAS